MGSAVSRPPAAESARALKHFERLLEFETDCWDQTETISIKLLNVRFWSILMEP